MRFRSLLTMRGAVVLCCLMCASCATERIVDRPGARPVWVRSVPDSTEERVLVVGQALGRNVLDEPVMRERAMADAREQLARRLQTRLQSRSEEVVERWSTGVPGSGEKAREEYYREVRTRARERLHGVTLRETYWEKWRVDPGLFRRSFTRYKYYCLASYPREEYQRVMQSYVRLTEERQRAARLMDQGEYARAATVMEDLLAEHDDPPLAISLMLSRAHEESGDLLRAEQVLETALRQTEDPDEQQRINARLEDIRSTFPDLQGRTAYVVLKADQGTSADVAVKPAWVEEACGRSNLQIVNGAPWPVETDAQRLMNDARRAGAGWILEINLSPHGAVKMFSHHGLELIRARVESGVRVLRAGDGGTLAAASSRARSVQRNRETAVSGAAQRALHLALREAFLNAKGRKER